MSWDVIYLVIGVFRPLLISTISPNANDATPLQIHVSTIRVAFLCQIQPTLH